MSYSQQKGLEIFQEVYGEAAASGLEAYLESGDFGVETARWSTDFAFGTVASDDSYIEDYPDFILPADGSEVALEYDNSRKAAVCYTGSYGSGYPVAQLVYLAFPFETISQPDDRVALMARALRYFGFPTGVMGRPVGEPRYPR